MGTNAQHRISRKILKEKRRVAGVCIECGNKRERFKYYCAKCLGIRSTHNRNYYQKHKKKRLKQIVERYEYNKKHGLCVGCSQKLVSDIETGVRCVNCTETIQKCKMLNGG